MIGSSRVRSGALSRPAGDTAGHALRKRLVSRGKPSGPREKFERQNRESAEVQVNTDPRRSLPAVDRLVRALEGADRRSAALGAARGGARGARSRARAARPRAAGAVRRRVRARPDRARPRARGGPGAPPSAARYQCDRRRAAHEPRPRAIEPSRDRSHQRIRWLLQSRIRPRVGAGAESEDRVSKRCCAN